MIQIVSFFESVASGIDSLFSSVSIGGLNLKSVIISVFIVSCVLSLVRKKSAN